MDKRIVNHSRKIRTNKSRSILLGIARHRVFPKASNSNTGIFYIRVLLAFLCADGEGCAAVLQTGKQEVHSLRVDVPGLRTDAEGVKKVSVACFSG
jgi:hypothetical protein